MNKSIRPIEDQICFTSFLGIFDLTEGLNHPWCKLHQLAKQGGCKTYYELSRETSVLPYKYDLENAWCAYCLFMGVEQIGTRQIKVNYVKKNADKDLHRNRFT